MYVSLWQSLSPGFPLMKRKGTMGSLYPFNQPLTHSFYYARSGIYHLACSLRRRGLTKVLFPAYNHGVEIEAMRTGGQELVYYNIRRSGEIDYDDLERVITPDTRVLYIIHYNGIPQDMNVVMDLKKRHDLVLIEDVALSLFARHGDTFAGTFGEASIFSLYKTLAIPNGGMLVINQPEFDIDVKIRKPDLVSTLSRLGNLNLDWLSERYEWIGHHVQNARAWAKRLMASSQIERVPVGDGCFDLSICDWGMSNMSRLIVERSDMDEIVRTRRDNFDTMHSLVRSLCPEAVPMYSRIPPGAVPLFYPVLVSNREQIHHSLLNSGVESSRFWSEWHPDIPIDRFPDVTFLRKSVLELPIHQSVTRSQLEYTVEKLKNAVSQHGDPRSVMIPVTERKDVRTELSTSL